ncbi:MAG: archaemetzincin, partial [Bacteroidota bacterium]
MKCLCFIFIVFLFSCGSRNTVDNNESDGTYDSIRKLSISDIPLPVARPGDWLYEHKEKGQSFLDYKKCRPVSPNDTQSIIYIQPIGNFSQSTDSIIHSTVEYLHYFFGLKITLLPVISDSLIKPAYKRTREDGHQQYLTTFILDSLLVPRLPKDGIALMAITDTDLYPKESWNYVFGQAYTWKKVGISSIYRYIENDEPKKCLQRLIQTSSHEIGHMFSILHCTNAICVMNGSNSMEESDSRPNRLCSVCLNKLNWNLKFNNKIRFKQLRSYFEENHI